MRLQRLYALYTERGEVLLSGNKREEKHSQPASPFLSVLNIEYPFGKDRSRSVCKREGYREPGQTECSRLERVAMVTVNSISPTWNQLGVGGRRAFAGKWIRQREEERPAGHGAGMRGAPGAEGAER